MLAKRGRSSGEGDIRTLWKILYGVVLPLTLALGVWTGHVWKSTTAAKARPAHGVYAESSGSAERHARMGRAVVDSPRGIVPVNVGLGLIRRPSSGRHKCSARV